MIAACQIANIVMALGLACGVMAALRGMGIGRRPPAVDPYFHPFGDMPGFTREELETIARRPVELHHDTYTRRAGDAYPSSVAGSGRLPISSADSAARTPVAQFGSCYRAF